MSETHPVRRIARTTGRILLGMFILWQLAFLATDNLVCWWDHTRSYLSATMACPPMPEDLLQDRARAQEAIRQVGRITARWSEVTGQPQGWTLFGPGVTTDIPFVAVELRWDDDHLSVEEEIAHLAPAKLWQAAIRTLLLEQARGAPVHEPVWLLSRNEPEDPMRFCRLGEFRLRRYEGYLDAPLRAPADAKEWEARVHRQATAAHKVRQRWPLLRAYLRWREQEFRQSHPTLPPAEQVILHVRLYQVPPPTAAPWQWPPGEQYPLARWRPSTPDRGRTLPLDRYDPVTGRFETVRRMGFP